MGYKWGVGVGLTNVNPGAERISEVHNPGFPQFPQETGLHSRHPKALAMSPHCPPRVMSLHTALGCTRATCRGVCINLEHLVPENPWAIFEPPAGSARGPGDPGQCLQ